MPTCVVITNCESSANNETQFNSLFSALKKDQIYNFLIDEKKCGTTKNMISYIQKTVSDMIGADIENNKRYDYKNFSDHKIEIEVSECEDDIDNEEDYDDFDSDDEYVSPARKPTADFVSIHEANNSTINKEFKISGTTRSDYSRTRNQKENSQYLANDIPMENGGMNMMIDPYSSD